MDEFGLIYVVDKDNHRIQVFDSNGNYMRKFGSKGGSIGQFNHPLYIAIHRRTQNIFISDSANHRICVHDHDGVPILNFGIEGFHTGQLKLPRGLALDDQVGLFTNFIKLCIFGAKNQLTIADWHEHTSN